MVIESPILITNIHFLKAMHSQKHGYIIIDCNTTSLDLQPLLFLLEYSSVLCITLSGNKEVPLSRAYHETLKILSLIGRYDVPVIRRSPSGVADPAHCLSRICARFPHKVSVVCLGPLTNLAVALQLNRKFEKNVKRIVCVADGFNGRRMVPNWNFKVSCKLFVVFDSTFDLEIIDLLNTDFRFKSP